MKSTRGSLALSIFLVLTALFIFTISFIRVSSKQISSKLNTSTPLVMTTTNSVPIHTDYQLPDPGILPTHPLYPLKMIRDRLRLIIEINPDQRPLLLLHYANKRLATAKALIEAGHSKPAISVALKAEIYLGQAIDALTFVKPATQLLLIDQFQQATLKHEEIVELLMNQTQGESHNQAAGLYQQLDLYRTKLEAITKSPFKYIRPEDLIQKTATDSATPASSSATMEPYL